MALHPQAMFNGLEREEQFLRHLLLANGMCSLIPEEEVPTTNAGRKLLAGLFCVPHKNDFDRLFFDRRPQISIEGRLKWCDLPHGTCFCSLRLKLDEDVRCSGEDISKYCYHSKLVVHAQSVSIRSSYHR